MPSLKNFAARLPGGAARAWAPLLGEATEAKGAIYARNTCPHCSSRLAKLPLRSMKCPSCQQPIVRIRGDDYVVYLLREEDAGPLRKEMDDHWALTRGWSEAGGRWDPEAIRRLRRVWMARYAALGLGVRVVVWGSGPCGPCRSLSKTVFEPAKAPELPLRECRNTYCNCRYEPVIKGSPRPRVDA
jgi:hypothetical protein